MNAIIKQNGQYFDTDYSSQYQKEKLKQKGNMLIFYRFNGGGAHATCGVSYLIAADLNTNKYAYFYDLSIEADTNLIDKARNIEELKDILLNNSYIKLQEEEFKVIEKDE